MIHRAEELRDHFLKWYSANIGISVDDERAQAVADDLMAIVEEHLAGCGAVHPEYPHYYCVLYKTDPHEMHHYEDSGIPMEIEWENLGNHEVNKS